MFRLTWTCPPSKSSLRAYPMNKRRWAPVESEKLVSPELPLRLPMQSSMLQGSVFETCPSRSTSCCKAVIQGREGFSNLIHCPLETETRHGCGPLSRLLRSHHQRPPGSDPAWIGDVRSPHRRHPP